MKTSPLDKHLALAMMHAFGEHLFYFKAFLAINDDGLDCLICQSAKPCWVRMVVFDII